MDHIKYAFIALVGWGFWAIGSKLLTRQFSAANAAFWISLWSFMFLIVYLFVRKEFVVNKYSLLALPVGMVSIIAILAFYQALKDGPTSIVIPLTNLYVLFPVIFGIIALHEQITVLRIIGIIFALVASILLSL